MILNLRPNLEDKVKQLVRSPEMRALFAKYGLTLDCTRSLQIVESATQTNNPAELNKDMRTLVLDSEFLNSATEEQLKEVLYHELAHYVRSELGIEGHTEGGEGPDNPDEFAILKDDVDLKRMQGKTDGEIREYLTQRFKDNPLSDAQLKELLKPKKLQKGFGYDRPPHLAMGSVRELTALSFSLGMAYKLIKKNSADDYIIIKDALCDFLDKMYWAANAIKDEVYASDRNKVSRFCESMKDSSELLKSQDFHSLSIDQISRYAGMIRDSVMNFVTDLKYVDAKFGFVSEQLKRIETSFDRYNAEQGVLVTSSLKKSAYFGAEYFNGEESIKNFYIIFIKEQAKDFIEHGGMQHESPEKILVESQKFYSERIPKNIQDDEDTIELIVKVMNETRRECLDAINEILKSQPGAVELGPSDNQLREELSKLKERLDHLLDSKQYEKINPVVKRIKQLEDELDLGASARTFKAALFETLRLSAVKPTEFVGDWENAQISTWATAKTYNPYAVKQFGDLLIRLGYEFGGYDKEGDFFTVTFKSSKSPAIVKFELQSFMKSWYMSMIRVIEQHKPRTQEDIDYVRKLIEDFKKMNKKAEKETKSDDGKDEGSFNVRDALSDKSGEKIKSLISEIKNSPSENSTLISFLLKATQDEKYTWCIPFILPIIPEADRDVKVEHWISSIEKDFLSYDASSGIGNAFLSLVDNGYDIRKFSERMASALVTNLHSVGYLNTVMARLRDVVLKFFGALEIRAVLSENAMKDALKYFRKRAVDQDAYDLDAAIDYNKMSAAMKDPVTGQVYTGPAHADILQDLIKANKVDAFKRLQKEYRVDSVNIGFVEPDGKFISRDEAEKKYGFRTSQELSLKQTASANDFLKFTADLPNSSIDPNNKYYNEILLTPEERDHEDAEMFTRSQNPDYALCPANHNQYSHGSEGKATTTFDWLKEILDLDDNTLDKSSSLVVAAGYTGVMLDEDSHNRLVDALRDAIPAGWEVVAHHMTINLGPDKYGLSGKEFTLTATEFAIDEKVAAVKVETDAPSDKPLKHVTVAVNRAAGGKPQMSDNLKNWTAITPILLKGIVKDSDNKDNKSTNKNATNDVQGCHFDQLPRSARIDPLLEAYPENSTGARTFENPEEGYPEGEYSARPKAKEGGFSGFLESLFNNEDEEKK